MVVRQALGAFDRVSLCPTNPGAYRFQKHFKGLEDQLRIPIDVKSANQLALQSRGDEFVVIVQSDTRVLPGWLRHLVEEANSLPRFATLSPVFLSDEDFLSLRGLEDGANQNDRPLSFARIVQALSTHPSAPEIITIPSETCILVSAEAMEKLSFESKENLFSNNYPMAEELRQWEFYALNHFATPKTFVVPRNVVRKCEQPLMKKLFAAVELYGASTDLPPILYVLHEDIIGSIGGTELHTEDLVVSQKKERRVFVLFRKENFLILRFFFRGSERKFVYSFSGISAPSFFSYPEIENIFLRILADFKIGIVHFQHLLGLPLSLLSIARTRCATAITMNDYFLYCENYDFLDFTGNYCGAVKDPETCDRCLSKSPRPYRVGPVQKGQTYRRRYWLSEELKKHSLIYPSKDTRDRFLDLYSLDAKRSLLLEPPSSNSRIKPAAKKAIPTLNISYLGVFNFKKGAKLFCDLVLHLNQKFPDRLCWFVFGKVADSGIASSLLDQKNVTFLGEYRRSEATSLIETHQIDLNMLLSIWPETYSFTLTEAFLSGIPVISTNLGAQGQRVGSAGAGWTVEMTSAIDEIEQIIQSIFDDPQTLLSRRSRVPELPSHLEQLEKFKDFYSSLISQKTSLEQARSEVNPTEAES